MQDRIVFDLDRHPPDARAIQARLVPLRRSARTFRIAALLVFLGYAAILVHLFPHDIPPGTPTPLSQAGIGVQAYVGLLASFLIVSFLVALGILTREGTALCGLGIGCTALFAAGAFLAAPALRPAAAAAAGVAAAGAAASWLAVAPHTRRMKEMSLLLPIEDDHREEIALWRAKHPTIAAYLDKVDRQGREPVEGEYWTMALHALPGRDDGNRPAERDGVADTVHKPL